LNQSRCSAYKTDFCTQFGTTEPADER
jgi:hypothetical protein